MTIPVTILFAMLAGLSMLKTAPLAAAPARSRTQPGALRHARPRGEPVADQGQQRVRFYQPYR